jgi:hypothetical protein
MLQPEQVTSNLRTGGTVAASLATTLSGVLETVAVCIVVPFSF